MTLSVPGGIEGLRLPSLVFFLFRSSSPRCSPASWPVRRSASSRHSCSPSHRSASRSPPSPGCTRSSSPPCSERRCSRSSPAGAGSGATGSSPGCRHRRPGLRPSDRASVLRASPPPPVCSPPATLECSSTRRGRAQLWRVCRRALRLRARDATVALRRELRERPAAHDGGPLGARGGAPRPYSRRHRWGARAARARARRLGVAGEPALGSGSRSRSGSPFPSSSSRRCPRPRASSAGTWLPPSRPSTFSSRQAAWRSPGAVSWSRRRLQPASSRSPYPSGSTT